MNSTPDPAIDPLVAEPVPFDALFLLARTPFAVDCFSYSSGSRSLASTRQDWRQP